jgi:hypothetical protein
MTAKDKKVYATPRLTVYGTIQEITTAQNKDLGGSDGFLFQSQPIQNVS